MPNVHLLHSLFNEYSERQINTDRTAVKGGGGEEEEASKEENQRRGRAGRVQKVKGTEEEEEQQVWSRTTNWEQSRGSFLNSCKSK